MSARWGVLWTLREEALPLVVIDVSLALILGLIGRRVALGIVSLLLLFPLLASFVEPVVGNLAPWVPLVIM